MLQRPGKRKASKRKKAEQRASTIKLFAFCVLMVPLALGIAAWVMRFEIWANFMLESQVTQTYRPRVLKALGRTAQASAETKQVAEELVLAVQTGKLGPTDIAPLGEAWETAMADKELTREEARALLDQAKDLLLR